MATPIHLLSDQEMQAVLGGSAAPGKAGMPGLGQNASVGPAGQMARKLGQEIFKQAVVEQGLRAAGAGLSAAGQAIRTIPRHENPKPLVERTHRWLN